MGNSVVFEYYILVPVCQLLVICPKWNFNNWCLVGEMKKVIFFTGKWRYDFFEKKMISIEKKGVNSVEFGTELVNEIFIRIRSDKVIFFLMLILSWENYLNFGKSFFFLVQKKKPKKNKQREQNLDPFSKQQMLTIAAIFRKWSQVIGFTSKRRFCSN